MSTPKPLDERIVAILTKDCTSADAAAIRTEAEEELSRMVAEADSADVASLSPLATAEQANTLRRKAGDLRFAVDRLEAQVSALSARVADLKDSERRAVEDAERTAAIAERDELAKHIAEYYPKIVRQLTEMVKRIEESDGRCARSRIMESAEALARGVPANFYSAAGPVTRIADIKLPMPSDVGRCAWEHNPMSGARNWRGLELPQAMQ